MRETSFPKLTLPVELLRRFKIEKVPVLLIDDMVPPVMTNLPVPTGLDGVVPATVVMISNLSLFGIVIVPL